MKRNELLKALLLGVVLTLLALAAVLLPVSRLNIVDDLASLPRYDLDRVRRTGIVTAPFIDAITADLSQLDDAGERKDAFLRILLPLVIRENQRLLLLRQTLLRSPDSAAADLGPRFGLGGTDRDALLRRIDIIPVSLALAQAGVESGWGTSRFARDANSFFGQRTFNSAEPGLSPRETPRDSPRESGASFRVRGFATIAQSVRAYMHNLNTHPAYQALRRARQESRRAHGAPRGSDLLAHLLPYSEERERYVATVRRVMADNRLADFDRARMAGW
jgi:Bax protein